MFTPAAHHRRLDAFPTRRSSDLIDGSAGENEIGGAGIADDARQEIAQAGIRRQTALDEYGLETREFRTDTQIGRDRKSTRLNSSHPSSSYAVFCLKKKKHHAQGR